MNSSPNSNFGLQSLVNKVKDSLKSLSTDSLSFGDKDMCRVTTAEVKQLQRVCEELMMRCLNLETDLQFALDLNIQLHAQLSAPVWDGMQKHSSFVICDLFITPSSCSIPILIILTIDTIPIFFPLITYIFS